MPIVVRAKEEKTMSCSHNGRVCCRACGKEVERGLDDEMKTAVRDVLTFEAESRKLIAGPRRAPSVYTSMMEESVRRFDVLRRAFENVTGTKLGN
jgi:hypothetical protein